MPRLVPHGDRAQQNSLSALRQTRVAGSGVPSLAPQLKRPHSWRFARGGLPSRRRPASLCRHAVRVPGLQCGEHPHRTLKEFKKEKYCSPGPRLRNGLARLKKRASKRMRNRCYIISFFILGLLRPSSCCGGAFFICAKVPGSLAISTASLCASSRDRAIRIKSLTHFFSSFEVRNGFLYDRDGSSGTGVTPFARSPELSRKRSETS